MLQVLADIALTLCNAGSAGITLLESGGDHEPVFCWTALSGHCADLVDKVIPRGDSSAGVPLALGAAQLSAFPQRHWSHGGLQRPRES
ncbi:hypothetical protein GCT19_35670 [Paraburkholderia sp. CNPSo 3155]|uniref:hypothetical protein n=1 Tax=Paraburkholderia atlantica TaxID=2654982 RepID=UPI00128C3F03|nr:hypothetical protein [Paraburkholderia atlantica]MPW10868.1 hypothetical protein [Paraburkholderia atlantica]